MGGDGGGERKGLAQEQHIEPNTIQDGNEGSAGLG